MSFWTKFPRDGDFQSITEKVHTTLWQGLEIAELKATPEKYHLVNSRDAFSKTITNKKWKKIAGIKIYKELKFNGHSQVLLKEASQKTKKKKKKKRKKKSIIKRSDIYYEF